jgi:hypothetical protein
MHTLADGYFYIPNLPNINSVQLLQYRNDSYLEGDCQPTPIDGNVDLKDYYFVTGKYGTYEGDSDWDYMADIVPDRTCDLKDVTKVSYNYGQTGSYLYDVETLQVEWSNGQTDNVPSDGKLAVPEGVTYFYVKKNGSGVHAYIIFSDEELVTKQWHDMDLLIFTLTTRQWNPIDSLNFNISTKAWFTLDTLPFNILTRQWHPLDMLNFTILTKAWNVLDSLIFDIQTKTWHPLDWLNFNLTVLSPTSKIPILFIGIIFLAFLFLSIISSTFL